jgi:Flp pilus assembly pilin Flp
MLMTYFRSLLAQLTRNEEGQTAVEYGLVLALISAAVVAAIATGILTTVVTAVMNAITGAF